MLKRFNIRQRILIIFLAIALTGGLAQLVIAGWQLQQATLDFHQHHLETDALMIASTLAEPLEEYLDEGDDDDNRYEIQRLLGSFQQEVDHDYLIVDRHLRVVGFTAGTGYESLDRVSSTPELVGAADGRIGSDIRDGHDGAEHLFVAVPVRYEGDTLGYLILSQLMQPAYDEVMREWLELGSITFPVIILVVVAALWVSGTISRPVQRLNESALKMAEGALDTRIISDTHDEVGQLGHTFNYMAERLEILMQTQRSFVSNAAHELRTPLMTLKLRIEALEDDTLPPQDATRYIEEMRQEVNHMAELVSSLLVLARLDENRHQSTGVITDTATTLHDIARHWRIAAKQNGLGCEPEIPDQLPELPITPNDLRLVLDNVLSNAIKYTDAGQVCFRVTTETDAVVMQVRDTGIGFDPAQAEQLFGRFYRSEVARTSGDGHGLGLSIVKAILERYGASITAESPGLGKGATFTIRVPKTILVV